MEDKKPTDQQIRLVQMIANDLSQADIASQIGVHIRTVENRLRKLRATMGGVSLHRVCVEYYKLGLIS